MWWRCFKNHKKDDVQKKSDDESLCVFVGVRLEEPFKVRVVVRSVRCSIGSLFGWFVVRLVRCSLFGDSMLFGSRKEFRLVDIMSRK